MASCSLRPMKDKIIDTAGRRLLLKRLESKTQADLARELGIKRSALCRWVKGDRRPDGDTRLLLEEKIKIPCNAWITFINVDSTEDSDAVLQR